MTITRNNHYVPQWYQKGFINDGANELCHLSQKKISLPNNEVREIISKRWYTPAQCFYKKDLYTTYLGTKGSDDIEKKLFGDIDDTGAIAVKAYLTDDHSEWHSSFESLFFYLDAQKIRTPKGLDWIKNHYFDLTQNQLMIEMQSITRLHCTLWMEGIRELVSAEDSEVKFIISDHPVTVYNYACPPDSKECQYPNDPDISLKGTQTIFPLDKNRCLILTNQEYAQNPYTVDPLEQRTNPTKLRSSLVSTIDFIHHRKLNSDEVSQINYIIKKKSKESIAAGAEDWLYPEKSVDVPWSDLRHVLFPPRQGFTNEILAKFNDGSVYYQDAFGRKKSDDAFLKKNINESELLRNDNCGCGSGKKYKKCCLNIPKDKRTSWSVLSIRERNLALCNAIRNILGIDKGKTWDDIRQGISDSQISEIYSFYVLLWPADTEIYSLLPRPDKKFRALYSGLIDIKSIVKNVLNRATHFDEFLIQHPFIYSKYVNPDISPVKNPDGYRYQAIKDFYFMLVLEPFIASGVVNIFPDLSIFDRNLCNEYLKMADLRKYQVESQKEKELFTRMRDEDFFNISYKMPTIMRKKFLSSLFPYLNEERLLDLYAYLDKKSKVDPLVPLYDVMLGGKSQYIGFALLPNYEMSLFTAQVTGSVIVTDSESRWMEFQLAQHRVNGIAYYPWKPIHDSINKIPLDSQVVETFVKSSHSNFIKFRNSLKAIHALVSNNNQNIETISKWKAEALDYEDKVIREIADKANIKILAPKGGFHDTNVQRLLLKSNCQHYFNKVNSVYYLTSE